MKKLIILFLFLYALKGNAQTPINADTTQSVINWTGHAEVGSYAPSGTLKLQNGWVYTRNHKITGAAFWLAMNTLYQENKNLTEHLKSSDFFDVTRYPLSFIKITRISNGVAYGTLTIRGETHPIQMQTQINPPGDVITGKAVIDRTAYHIIYNSGSFFSDLKDRAIANNFEVEFRIKLVHVP